MAPMAVALTIAAYLLGTFPTAVLVARAKGHDVTQEGSGNPGATNVYRVAGRRAAVFVFAGDLLKGVIATGVGLAVADRTTALAMGAAAVVGHCLPVTRRFKGGKGVATAAGFAVVIEPVIGLVAGVCWLIVLKATKRASLASLAIVVALPLAVLARRGPHIEALVVSLVAVFIVSRHARNIARLVRGEEASLRGVERSG
ncbi:MAG: acyl phosphate:glycerol-3-phosphate acyltransferase [Acidimicrobiaceae bacterium]|nr:acyl phosphate:glycerol-3-phosphate acyltransferase [Acidimicrobiaceae bacterium]